MTLTKLNNDRYELRTLEYVVQGSLEDILPKMADCGVQEREVLSTLQKMLLTDHNTAGFGDLHGEFFYTRRV